jgi:hypothetical protein
LDGPVYLEVGHGVVVPLTGPLVADMPFQPVFVTVAVLVVVDAGRVTYEVVDMSPSPSELAAMEQP